MKLKVEHPIMVDLRGALICVAPDVSEAILRVTRDAIDLHAPVAVRLEDGYVVTWQCHGCDPGSYVESSDLPEGPCRTLRTIADALGVQVPQ